MSDEPELYLQVVGFDGLHGVKDQHRKVDHITWRTEIVESDQYMSLDRMERLMIRELIDLQAQGGGIVPYRVNEMRRLWGRSMEKRLARLIVGGVVNVVERCGTTAIPRGAIATHCGTAAIERGTTATRLLEISKGYKPRIRNMNIRGRACGQNAPRATHERDKQVSRRDFILNTIQKAAAINNLEYAFLQCRLAIDEEGSNPTRAEFLDLWTNEVQPKLVDDDPAKAWQPNGGSA